MNHNNQAILTRGSLAVAIASGVFLLLMGGMLLFNQAHGKVASLVDTTQLVRLHEELRQRPRDEVLKQHIRQLDLQLRQKSFSDLRLSQNGARSMLLASALFLFSAHLVRSQRRKLPDPLSLGQRRAAEEKRTSLKAQYAVAAVFGVVSAAAVCLFPYAVQLPSPLPTQTAAIRFPAMTEMRENWPAFRGFDGSGYREQGTIPTTWNVAGGQGIRWKAEVPLPGMSSPVRWGNALFLTGADTQTNAVFKFDATSGALVWSAALRVPGTRMPSPSVSEDTSLAAPTPVTDGQRVYAIFANADVAALDFSGKQIWCRNVGPLNNNPYGHASSLAIYQDRLLVQLDQGEATSKLLALDPSTGQELWQIPRPIVSSWASPIVIEVEGKPQLVTCGQPWVIGYNPSDGSELWRAKGLDSSELAPSPVYAGDKVIACNPGGMALAIRANSQGDVTTNVAWKTDSGVPSVPSPASDGKRLYFLTGEGLLTCLDPETGQAKWSHDFEDEFYSSPVIAGSRVMIVTRKGIAHILENADQFHELGKNELGENCNATPALDRQCLYVRGAKHLFCLADSARAAAANRSEK